MKIEQMTRYSPDGPGADVDHAVDAAVRKLNHDLEHLGYGDAVFVVSVYLPSLDEGSKKVFRMGANISPEDAEDFIRHLAVSLVPEHIRARVEQVRDVIQALREAETVTDKEKH